MSELDELRNEVDAADDAILAALMRRFAITDRIRELKTARACRAPTRSVSIARHRQETGRKFKS